MPASVLTTLADEVAAMLSPTVLAAPGAISREYVPLEELKDLAALVVTVIPRMLEQERIARKVWQRDYTIDVGVQKRAADAAAIDTLTALVESLSDVLEGTDPATVRVSLITCKVVGPDPGHLKEYGCFTAVITAVYRGGRIQA